MSVQAEPERGTVASCGTLLRVPWSAAVLALGALLYAGSIGFLGVTFDATPLLVGAIALAAALLGRTPRLTATAFTLIGWGAAVMLTRHGPLPDEREAAAFLVGSGLGLLAARLVAWRRPDVDVGDGSSVLVVGGMAFFLAVDADWLYDWPVWSAALLGWALWEWFTSRRRPALPATAGGAAPPRP